MSPIGLLVVVFIFGLACGVGGLFCATLFSDRLQRWQNNGKTFAESREEYRRQDVETLIAMINTVMDRRRQEDSGYSSTGRAGAS